MPVSALVKVACRRWTIEESFAASKELAALDQHQFLAFFQAGEQLGELGRQVVEVEAFHGIAA